MEDSEQLQCGENQELCNGVCCNLPTHQCCEHFACYPASCTCCGGYDCCSAEEKCAEGKCISKSQCYPECSKDKSCCNGTCCTQSERCIKGACQLPKSCSSPTYSCGKDTGLGCYRACTSNADCVDGNCNSTTELCETGRCLPIINIKPSCTENTDCPGGYYCSDKYCIPSKAIGACDPSDENTCSTQCVKTGSVKGCCPASATAVQLVGDPNSPSIVCCETDPCGDGFCCDKDHPCTNGKCLRSACEDIQCFGGDVCYEGQCVSPNCENDTSITCDAGEICCNGACITCAGSCCNGSCCQTGNVCLDNEVCCPQGKVNCKGYCCDCCGISNGTGETPACCDTRCCGGMCCPSSVYACACPETDTDCCPYEASNCPKGTCCQACYDEHDTSYYCKISANCDYGQCDPTSAKCNV